jgi:antitoxin VapB
MALPERHVRLFRNGRNQALRIPREFELEGDEAILRKEGDRLIVERSKGSATCLLSTRNRWRAFPMWMKTTPLDVILWRLRYLLDTNIL